MKYHNITKDDMLNGDGLRVVLWVAGCSHHCKNCQNPVTWNPDDGLEFTGETKQEIFTELRKSYVSGITFSGGDPLHALNVQEVTRLAKEIRENFPDKTIWIYTGFLWSEIKHLEIMKFADVVVDGKYVEELRDTQLYWRGSSNQRVIDVRKSLETGKVVLHCE